MTVLWWNLNCHSLHPNFKTVTIYSVLLFEMDREILILGKHHWNRPFLLYNTKRPGTPSFPRPWIRHCDTTTLSQLRPNCWRQTTAFRCDYAICVTFSTSRRTFRLAVAYLALIMFRTILHNQVQNSKCQSSYSRDNITEPFSLGWS
jgi:hypothetical protein